MMYFFAQTDVSVFLEADLINKCGQFDLDTNRIT